jgi:GMP synthase (glutamine-hydrolysing)
MAGESAELVLILQHQAGAGPGWLGDVLAEAGVPARIVAPYDGEPVPTDPGWKAIVALGGRMGAYDVDEFPFLNAEKQLLARAALADVPVLGICLGSQLLADALGGRTYPAPQRRLGYPSIELTTAGAADPVVQYLHGPVLAWHGDTFDLPPQAQLLATSSGYPYAFRAGSALALQVHPEASPAIIEGWLGSVGDEDIRGMGFDPRLVRTSVRRNAAAARRTSRAMFRAWLAEIARPRR